MQISHQPAVVKQNLKKKMLIEQKHAVRIKFNLNKRPFKNSYQINLLQVLKFMQKIKTSTSPSVISTYFQPINHVYETRFSEHNCIYTPDTFTKYVKFSISYRGLKLRNNYPTTSEKNIVCTTFFKRRIKEKLFPKKNELTEAATGGVL